jgi:hypothetical protein
VSGMVPPLRCCPRSRARTITVGPYRRKAGRGQTPGTALFSCWRWRIKPFKAGCRDQRLIVLVGSLATVAFSPLIFLTSRVAQALDADHRGSRRSQLPQTGPRLESCFKAPKRTVDCRIVIRRKDRGKAPGRSTKSADGAAARPALPAARHLRCFSFSGAVRKTTSHFRCCRALHASSGDRYRRYQTA